MEEFVSKGLELAILEASRYRGATSPNPPVGAVGLDSKGRILSIQAHERAGTMHAEAKVIADCESRGILPVLRHLIVTLEPCNHYGRTPPCVDGIRKADIQKVYIGALDPNPNVRGGGTDALRRAGIGVEILSDSRCIDLIGPFAHWARTGLPWVTVKTALSSDGSMIPPLGRKTFTSENSLIFAHSLRRRVDAIITGSGTVLADLPLFTVRLVSDHLGKSRWLVLMDRRRRISMDWLQQAEIRGFQVVQGLDYVTALRFLGEQDCLEVLVEAGPTLSNFILSGGGWNQHVVIHQGQSEDLDRIEVFDNVHWNHPEKSSGPGISKKQLGLSCPKGLS